VPGGRRGRYRGRRVARLVGGDLDGGRVDDIAARGREQVSVRVADGERVQQQPADGVRDLGLPAEDSECRATALS
jgi:hypothetical protein